MRDLLNYIDQNHARYLKELTDFLAIPSVSSNSKRKADVRKCAEYLADNFKKTGLEKVTIFETAGHPVVYAEHCKVSGVPTVLVYGHYDVQPEDPVDLWKSPPFKATIVGDELFARGASDDKGQLLVHLKAVEAYLKKDGKLPVNVKFIIEGEEEIGSPNLDTFVESHKELLKSDVLLVSDTAWFDRDVPSITYGVRGLIYLQMDVTGPLQDLHSGRFGGAVINPINALAGIISKLVDDNGRITVPGFYDDVIEPDREEQKSIKGMPFDEKKFCEQLGVSALGGESGFSTLEKLWLRPTFDVCGIWGGFQGEGSKTVLPAKAGAKISMRLVPNQNGAVLGPKLAEWVKKLAPKGVKIETKLFGHMDPGVVPLDSPGIKAGLSALEKTFGKKPLLQREGGSIPVAASFKRILGLDTVFMGFGLPDENAHSPNEKLNLHNFWGGIKASAHFLNEVKKVWNG